MNELVKGVIEELKLLEAGRNLKLNLKPLPAARGDQRMIRQVLTNLLSNAMKLTRPKPEAVIEIGGKIEGREGTYYIKDNGVGFDSADGAGFLRSLNEFILLRILKEQGLVLLLYRILFSATVAVSGLRARKTKEPPSISLFLGKRKHSFPIPKSGKLI